MHIEQSYRELQDSCNLNLRTGNLNCLFLNVRSLRVEGKLDKIKNYIDAYDGVDIICLVETWLQEDDLQFYHIPGYVNYHITRKEKRGGESPPMLVINCSAWTVRQLGKRYS